MMAWHPAGVLDLVPSGPGAGLPGCLDWQPDKRNGCWSIWSAGRAAGRLPVR